MASSNRDWCGSQVRGSECECWGWAWIPCTNSRAQSPPCSARLPYDAGQPFYTFAGGLLSRQLRSVSAVRPRRRDIAQTTLRSAATAGRQVCGVRVPVDQALDQETGRLTKTFEDSLAVHEEWRRILVTHSVSCRSTIRVLSRGGAWIALSAS
jgi:hypothetical protein